MTEDSLNTNDPKLKLFLRLPRDTFAATPSDEEFLKDELFRLLGDTTADRFMPRISKGHCFLFFTTRLRAAQAHDKLSNKVVKDYPLQPVFGFTREEQQAVDAGLQNKEIERNHRTLYIRGLPGNIQSSQLEQQFSQFGEIEKTNVVATKNSQVAFLVFRKFAPAHEAINAYQDGFEIGGQTAIVELSKNKNLRRRVEKFQQANMGMRGGFGPGGRNFGGRGGWGPPPFGGGRGYGGYGAPQWGSQNQWGGSRGGYGGYRGGRGRGGDRGRGGSYGGSRGRGGGFGGPSRGGYGGGRGTSTGGYGGGRGSTGGGAYGGGRGSHSSGAYGGGRGGSSGGAYGSTTQGGYGSSRGGWGSQQRGGGRGGGSSWQNKSFQPY